VKQGAEVIGGFQYWYLACFPDSIVAVRQGIAGFFVLGLSNDDGVTHPALFGLVGVLVNHLLKPKALAYRQRMEAMVQSGLTSGLRSKPNVVYEVTQLKAITCVAKRGAPLVLSELILETKSGSKQKFGVRPAELGKLGFICARSTRCRQIPNPQVRPTPCPILVAFPFPNEGNRTNSGPLSIQVCGHLANARRIWQYRIL
jgi:hypothetical protein